MALTTVADKTIGDIFTEAMWDTYIKDNINELIGRSGRSLLTNGGFEVWQRGAGAFASNNFWSADRWFSQRNGVAGAAQSVTQETTTTDGSPTSLRCVATSVDASNKPQINQKLDLVHSLRGQTMTFSVRVNQSVANACKPYFLESGSAYTYGGTSATTGSFVTLSVTTTIGGGSTSIEVGLEITANGTFYLDNAMLVLGPVGAAYVPLMPQEDLSRCERYYEVHGGVNPSMEQRGYNAAGTIDANFISFHTAKGGTPTMTKNGTWAVTNCSQPGTTSPTLTGYSLFVTVTALGGYQFNANSTDDTIAAEYNF